MITDTTWMPEYVQRREIVAASGYHWQEADAVWKRGRHELSDEAIDTMALTVLQDVLRRGR